VLSVSATTRPARRGERDGVNYHFIDQVEFERLAAADGFLEHANVHGYLYGTPRAPVEAAMAAGKTVLLEIDVQGARAVRDGMPDAVLIFVEPPSWEVLAQRLRGRKTEDEEAFALRMANAAREFAVAEDFDHRVVNDDLDDAVSEVLRILDAAPS
jgi:guanylate kinase